MFDVIVPIYKVKPIYLERCLKTISYDIQREYFEGDYKIFLIDKTPSDWEYFEECKAIIDSYDEINYFRQSGEGVSQARNQAVSLGSNPYICFLDGDDYWYDSHLFEISEGIKNSDEETMIWWSAMDMHLNSVLDDTKKNHYVINHIGDFDEWIEEFYYYYLTKTPICTSTVCVRRNRFEEVGGFLEDYAIGEDIEMWSRMVGHPKLSNKTYKAKQLPVITAYKTIHEDNTTEGGTQSFVFENSENEKIFEEQLQRIMELYKLPSMDDKPEHISKEEWENIMNRYTKVL